MMEMNHLVGHLSFYNKATPSASRSFDTSLREGGKKKGKHLLARRGG